MIKKITIKHFKKFKDASYEVNPAVSLLVGPNNGGKTTALQAISLWSSLIQEWNEKKGKASGSTAKKRSGAQVTRNAIYAVPVQEMKFLWFNTLTQSDKQQKISIQIIAEGADKEGKAWEYGVELNYGGPEVLYCKPMDLKKDIPEDVNKVSHLPPLSGVQTQERKVELGAQRHIIGEGRPGEILRNLLLQVQEKKDKWDDLCKQIKEMFNVQLEKISFNPTTDAHILVRYREVGSHGKGCLLEIASGGSGFLQFLLLAAFLYVHENSILLIDEPDSHMHVRLQQGMYDWLQQIAAKNNVQLLISTHSEVIINSTDTDYIYTFFGNVPKPIQSDKKHIVKALEEISTIDILNAQDKKFVLFAEGDTDFPLLKSWATKLEHDISKELNDMFYIPTQDNQINVAKRKFNSLKIVEPNLRGFFIRDNDVSETQLKDIPPGLTVGYWSRKEIENYLIIPPSLERFVCKQESPDTLFGQKLIEKAKKYLEDNLPPRVYKDPLNNDIDGKGSDFLDKFFREVNIKINKRDYWQIADVMDESEIHPDIKTMLDDLQKAMSSNKTSDEQ